ncbi:hypothetical protein NM208_g9564 [Fusarium decemcellulare]|uniref:Uncharacterized protein n=1 Tax=Fusarium decemcellulare TaxID=57161 RepID=A0ACC1S1D6_9HYPO|nr:hypothetical protein NM208_g9564 [Fusarium decemcellulare]
MSAPPSARGPGGAVDEAFIMRLPDEMLSKILDLAGGTIFKADTFWGKDYFSKTTIALATVCRRFNRIATPRLYYHLVVRWGKTDHATRSLHLTLRQRPELRQCCKRLTVIESNGNKPASSCKTPRLAMDLVSWLTGTNQLKIMANEKTAEIAMACVQALGDLASHNANLAMLCLSSFTESNWQSLHGLEGTAPFTALKLFQFSQTTRDLELILKWPAKLEELYFLPWSTCSLGGSGHWSFWRLQPMLDIHKSTLRKITIPELDEGDITNLNLSDYPNLEILELPATLTGKDVANIPRLVAPRLRVFRWNIITWRTESRVQPEDFDQAEEDWLRAFVQAAVERKVKLRQIFVDFAPTLFVGLLVDARYPWDRMDDVGRDVAQHGVKVGYLSPSITREEFNRARWVRI